MLVRMIPKGSGYLIVEKPPVLSVPLLKKYIEAEHDFFIHQLKETLIPSIEKASRRPFVMVLHDAVTLSNKVKYYSIAIQFVDSQWAWNHVVAISFGNSLSATTSNVVQQIKDVI